MEVSIAGMIALLVQNQDFLETNGIVCEDMSCLYSLQLISQLKELHLLKGCPHIAGVPLSDLLIIAACRQNMLFMWAGCYTADTCAVSLPAVDCCQ